MSENAEATILQQLMLCVGDSPASRFPVPGSKKANRMTVTSGRRCGASLLSCDPVGLLLRTCLEYDAFTLTRFYLTWKVWTTPQRRLIFRLSHSVPPTSGIGSLLWPTPKAGGNRNSRAAIIDSKGNGTHKSGLALEQAVEVAKGILPREVTSIGELPPKYRRLWPTPNARDWRSGKRVDGNAGYNQLNDQVWKAEGKECGLLNPTWVEWLMGFPLGWTDLEHSATP